MLWHKWVVVLATGFVIAAAQENKYGQETDQPSPALQPMRGILYNTSPAANQGVEGRIFLTSPDNAPQVVGRPTAVKPSRSAPDELKKVGEQWNDVKNRWANEGARHTKKLDKINSMPEGNAKQEALANEAAQHREISRDLAAERDAVHQKIIDEVNTRTAGGQTEASAPLEKTSGTKVSDPGHRGMDGDLDLGGGSRSADKVQEVLHDMGIDAKPKTTAGTVEFGDDLNITINKQGKMGPVGSSVRDTQLQVDAANKETYVSESMKKPDGTTQAGKDYVEVQDHKKKAMAGLESTPEDLVKNPDAARNMIKGAQKTMDGHLNDNEIQDIMTKNNISGTPDEFRQKMQDIKEGRTTLNPDEAGKMQQASQDIFNHAEQKTRTQASSELNKTQQKIDDLKASGDTEGARQLESELKDSQAKIKAVNNANGIADADADGQLTGNSRRPTTDLSEGPTRGQVPDESVGKPRTVTETPERVPGEPGKLGKVADTLGQVMVGVDIFSNAEDVKQAIQKGDTQKLIDIGVSTMDGFTGGALGTTHLLNDRLNTARGEKNDAQEQARQASIAANDQQMRVDLRKGGFNKEQVDQIMDAHAQGDDSQLKAGYAVLGKDMPKPEDTDPTWSQTLSNYNDEVADNAKDLAKGMADKAVKAGKFLNETRKDVTEIASGLTDSGTRTELIKQQSDNISDLWNNGSGRKENQAADQTMAGGKDAMVDYLQSHGATPEGAQKAADAMYDHGDASKFQKLMTLIRNKEAHQQNQPPPGVNDGAAGPDTDNQQNQDALKQQEPSLGDPNSVAAKQSATMNLLQWLMGTKDDQAIANAKTAAALNQANQQIDAATTAGDQQIQAANQLVNQAGVDAQSTVAQAVSQAAADQKNNSWGNVLGDAAIQSVASGGTALGNAIGASAAANAGANIFGSGKNNGSPTGTSGDQTVAPPDNQTTPTPISSGKRTTSGSGSGQIGNTGGGGTPVDPDGDNFVGQGGPPVINRGTSANTPLTSTASKTSTGSTLGSSKTFPPPPPPPPTGKRCPVCGGIVTDKDWYMSNYGPAIHCPHCHGAIKVNWSPDTSPANVSSAAQNTAPQNSSTASSTSATKSAPAQNLVCSMCGSTFLVGRVPKYGNRLLCPGCVSKLMDQEVTQKWQDSLKNKKQ